MVALHFSLLVDSGVYHGTPQGILSRPVQRLGRGGGGSNDFVPVLGGDGTKIALTGDIFEQLPGGVSSIRGKLADHVGIHVVLSPEGAVLVTSTGTESSYPRPPQSLNNSLTLTYFKASSSSFKKAQENGKTVAIL